MIHKFEQNDMKIVLDVNSSSVHVVDDIIWDIVEDCEVKSLDEIISLYSNKYDNNSIIEAYNEIIKLKDEGFLYTPDIYEERLMSANNEYHTKALCLNIAHDCNIRCKYCFASTGDYHGGRKLMSFEVAKKAIDFLLETSGSRKRLEVDFFGGEPLLNFDVVKKTVEYGRQREKEYNKHIGFTITTNAILLDDDKIDFINEHMHNIVLSIDGRKEVNDKFRVFCDGSGTYDYILPKIKNAVQKRGDMSYYIRGTFTAENLDFANDVLFFADQGFKEISIEPVVADSKLNYSLKKEHLPKIYKEYERLSKEFLRYQEEGRGFNFYHFMVDLDGGPCVYKRVTACGSGVEYFAVTPDGELYPCHQFVGNLDFLIGNVHEGITNVELQKVFAKNTVYHKEKCKNCWAKFYCSGGCRANAVSFNKDINAPYEMECELQKKRIECAIMIKAYQELNN